MTVSELLAILVNTASDAEVVLEHAETELLYDFTVTRYIGKTVRLVLRQKGDCLDDD